MFAFPSVFILVITSVFVFVFWCIFPFAFSFISISLFVSLFLYLYCATPFFADYSTYNLPQYLFSPNPTSSSLNPSKTVTFCKLCYGAQNRKSMVEAHHTVSAKNNNILQNADPAQIKKNRLRHNTQARPRKQLFPALATRQNNGNIVKAQNDCPQARKNIFFLAWDFHLPGRS